jgi:hypothetical protein
MMPTRPPVSTATNIIINDDCFVFIITRLDVIRWFLVIRSHAIQLKIALRLQMGGLYSFDKSINLFVYRVYTWLDGVVNQLSDFVYLLISKS